MHRISHIHRRACLRSNSLRTNDCFSVNRNIYACRWILLNELLVLPSDGSGECECAREQINSTAHLRLRRYSEIRTHDVAFTNSLQIRFLRSFVKSNCQWQSEARWCSPNLSLFFFILIARSPTWARAFQLFVYARKNSKQWRPFVSINVFDMAFMRLIVILYEIERSIVLTTQVKRNLLRSPLVQIHRPLGEMLYVRIFALYRLFIHSDRVWGVYVCVCGTCVCRAPSCNQTISRFIAKLEKHFDNEYAIFHEFVNIYSAVQIYEWLAGCVENGTIDSTVGIFSMHSYHSK